MVLMVVVEGLQEGLEKQLKSPDYTTERMNEQVVALAQNCDHHLAQALGKLHELDDTESSSYGVYEALLASIDRDVAFPVAAFVDSLEQHSTHLPQRQLQQSMQEAIFALFLLLKPIQEAMLPWQDAEWTRFQTVLLQRFDAVVQLTLTNAPPSVDPEPTHGSAATSKRRAGTSNVAPVPKSPKLDAAAQFRAQLLQELSEARRATASFEANVGAGVKMISESAKRPKIVEPHGTVDVDVRLGLAYSPVT